MATVSLTALVNVLREKQFLRPDHLNELPTLQATCADAVALARKLVQREWLTEYQARHLLQGEADKLILGPYRLLDLLGEGGMGKVFKARHAPMDRLVALKFIQAEQLAGAHAVERFTREARAAAQLSHPNIVLAHDAGRVGGVPYLAMEYVEGIHLARLVQQSGPLPVAQACDYARQAALGLQHAFERGVVHRDIKPGNLLVASGSARAPVVKILDFGLARFVSEGDHKGRLTQVGKIVGTVDYLSPEQAEDARKADIRADVYSLGCSLYYLLTGLPPFPGADVVERLSARLLGEPPAVRVVRPEVPAALESVLAKMMARDPAHRYQTPGEVAAALVPFAGQAIAVPSPLPGPSVGPKSMGDSGRRTAAGPKSGQIAVPKMDRPKSGVVHSGKTVAGNEGSGRIVAAGKKETRPVGDNPFASLEEGDKTSLKRSSARLGVAKPKAEAAGNKVLMMRLAIGSGMTAILAIVLVIMLPRGGDGKDKFDESGGSINKGDPITPHAKQDHKQNAPERKAGEEFTLTIRGDIKMKFAWIPPGTFQMGSDTGQKIEKPVHQVKLTKGFYMGVFLVTQSQWQGVMDNNPSHFLGDRRPVETVSWDDCRIFCEKMGELTGKPIRLPTDCTFRKKPNVTPA